MENILKLPIGIENFEKLRKENFYYVDKTGMIKKLLDNWGEVTLFTRPRRFGKSLNMNMLQSFFEYGCDETLFQDLVISREKTYREKYMGKFPVISITLKDTEAIDYITAKNMLRSIIGNEALRFQFLLKSKMLDEYEIERYKALIKITDKGSFTMSDEFFTDGLRTLCNLLHKHYGKKVILLIDEYDVPLAKAQEYGYYEEMVVLLRNLFGPALKENNSLYFSILTGCLRIAKESIFTGLNNLQVMSITDIRYREYFGFSDEEVRELLEFYGLSEKYELMKTWYAGYNFGGQDVYCPWDVINYCALLREDSEAWPQAFWINTSGNNIIRSFLQKATPAAKHELEQLIAGESVTQKIDQELTYRDLYSSMDNFWSVMFTTGYLTYRGKAEGKVYQLSIPNMEIREIFEEQIIKWFREEVHRDTSKLDVFCAAFLKGDAKAVEEHFNAYLRKIISIRDTGTRNTKKENFYHDILLGLLSHREDWFVISNAESGQGYSDILIESEEDSIGIVVEIKYSNNGNLEKSCGEALVQIEEKGYETRLRQDGMRKIVKLGIACYQKQCRVKNGIN